MDSPQPQTRRVRDTAHEYTELTLPNDANSLGTLFGGKLMQSVDIAAAISASRLARAPVVTASIDTMTFLRPVRIGQLVVLRSTVNRVFRSSMEVGVKVLVEDLITGEQAHVSSAYLTFVAISKDGQRITLPQVIPEGPEEERRYAAAEHRREYRLKMRETAGS
jgi:acyl-CoA hydrolase